MSQKSVSLTKYMRGANGKTVIHNIFTDLESALIKLRSEQYYSSHIKDTTVYYDYVYLIHLIMNKKDRCL